MFEIIKRYYEKNLYTKDQIKTFVVSGAITPAQYEEIVGEPYEK